MSFLKRQPGKLIRSALSLQAYKIIVKQKNRRKKKNQKNSSHRERLIYPQISFFPKQSNSFLKRMSPGFIAPFFHRGSLTVEAALVIPLFLFAVISILSFTEILRVQMKLNGSLQQTAKEMAVYAYAVDNPTDRTTDKTEKASVDLSDIALSETYVRSRTVSDLTGSYLENSPIGGAYKLSFLESRFMEKDRIKLRCHYYVTPFFALSKKAGFLTESSAVIHAFNGYDNAGNTADDEKEIVVYITESGRAYHYSRDCRYLDLSIRNVDAGQLSGLRNQSGGKYYACPICARSGTGVITYVTDYGDRYHYDLLCSGLKRTIRAVFLSQVGSRTPCSKCSGG